MVDSLIRILGKQWLFIQLLVPFRKQFIVPLKEHAVVYPFKQRSLDDFLVKVFITRLFLLLLVIICFCSCSDPNKSLKSVIASLEHSARKGDQTAFLENFSRSYWDVETEMDFSEIVRRSTYIFKNWKDLKYRVYEKSFYMEEETAVIVHSFTISGVYAGIEKNFSKKLKLALKKEQDAWKIQSGFVFLPLYNFSSPEKKAIRSIMTTRMKALNTKDLDLYLSVISKEYFDGKKQMNFEKISAKIRHYFELYDSIKFSIESMKISLSSGNTATVEEDFRMVIDAKGRTILDQTGRELISLSRDNKGKWQISAGL